MVIQMVKMKCDLLHVQTGTTVRWDGKSIKEEEENQARGGGDTMAYSTSSGRAVS